MKAFLILLSVLVVVVVLLALVNPMLMVFTGGKVAKVKSESQIDGAEIISTLILVDAESPLFVMSLDTPRPLAEKIGLGPPAGFQVAALEDKRSDPTWVENWNKENVHYVGKLQLNPNAATILRFPLTRPATEPFEIGGQLEAGRTVFNSITFFSIKVGH